MRAQPMKKNYKKPNICKVDFEILDLILESGGEDVGGGGDDPGWWFGSSIGPGRSAGGYDGSGF